MSAVIAVLVVVAGLAGLLTALGDGLSGGDVNLLLAVATVGVAVVVWLLQRAREPVEGTPAELEAIARALDEGGTTDPHIDAMARRVAEREARRTWFIRVSGLCAALQIGVVVFRVVTDNGWGQVGVAAFLAYSLGYTSYATAKRRRRARRYLASDRPREPKPSTRNASDRATRASPRPETRVGRSAGK